MGALFRKDEQGIAMITVLMVIVVLSTLAVSSLAYATGSLNLSRHDQDWNAAVAAAEAGVDDFVLHLNQDGNYYLYSATSPPPDGNAAFTGWVNVPGPANGAQFRYTVDASTIGVDGNVRVTSSGRVGKASRSVTSIVRRRNFLDYLYFTDFETLDPANYSDTAWADANCAKYQYAGRDSSCTNIQFFGNATRKDTINGPLHTNDTIRISGTPDFKGATSTSWKDPAGKRWFDAKSGGGSAPTFATTCPGSPPPAGCVADPKYAVTLDLPPSNSNLKNYTNPAPAANGCLFTGPTRIKLRSDGKADITSPYTKSSNCLSGPATSPVTISIPSDRVFFVQPIPASATDPNYSSCSGYPSGILPASGDAFASDFKCKAGDAFLSGVLKGQLTIGAANNIVIVGNTTYNTPPPGGSDVLGLIADNYVEMYHPVTSGGANISYAGGPVTDVQAAILSVRHSFRNQRYQYGAPMGTLSIRGAIGQRFRGPVGTFNGATGAVMTGYVKDYVYDQRLRFIAPPHFIDPVKSAWLVRSYAEIKPLY